MHSFMCWGGNGVCVCWRKARTTTLPCCADDVLCCAVQGVLVANRRSLTERPAQLLPIVHELLERLDAHLKAEDFYSGIFWDNFFFEV